jgi:hypothetical protein
MDWLGCSIVGDRSSLKCEVVKIQFFKQCRLMESFLKTLGVSGTSHCIEKFRERYQVDTSRHFHLTWTCHFSLKPYQMITCLNSFLTGNPFTLAIHQSLLGILKMNYTLHGLLNLERETTDVTRSSIRIKEPLVLGTSNTSKNRCVLWQRTAGFWIN